MAAQALVGIVMGSDSDWPVMQAAARGARRVRRARRGRRRLRAPSARQDDRVRPSAADRGLRVIIAGAGGAAHLPGMLASVTTLPVVGVPVPLALLDGLDSLLSIVQMPAGVPVATVSIGGAKNAGLLAARILASGEGARGDADPDGDGRVPGRAAGSGRVQGRATALAHERTAGRPSGSAPSEASGARHPADRAGRKRPVTDGDPERRREVGVELDRRADAAGPVVEALDRRRAGDAARGRWPRGTRARACPGRRSRSRRSRSARPCRRR